MYMYPLIEKMGDQDGDPLPQETTDGCDSDEWSDCNSFYSLVRVISHNISVQTLPNGYLSKNTSPSFTGVVLLA